ncbi:MAG: BamA/TamA family outer membrane protein [Elusimicrobia bacterium]|nr:BamA/TamA family outer membrane protein [Elusimicrobiota bacterium]
MRDSVVLALLLLAVPARSQIIQSDTDVSTPKTMPAELERPSESQPWPIRLMMAEFKHGMFVRLPVVDTDPNRGVTYGVMPIWVMNEAGSDRISAIHAPSLTYNNIFKVTPTYRYYRYPSDKAAYEFRASYSMVEDREILGEMEDLDFLGKGAAVHGEVHYNVDGSGRFFGLGPDSARTAESNFSRKTMNYSWRVGLPIFKDSGFKFNFGHRLAGERIAPGPVDSLPDLRQSFPAAAGSHWHQDGEFQLFVDYDTRDSVVTTTQGSYGKILVENSQQAWGSEFAFQRYELDLRKFYKRDPADRFVTAGHFLFQHMVGDVPFYLKPSMGGKYTHRAYGDGRYIDHALMTATVEERITLYKIPLAGVTTEFELAPFMGVGAVANSPHHVTARYARPVVGAAVRAIARPQVVGSIDVGVGREGPNVFMDINYSF